MNQESLRERKKRETRCAIHEVALRLVSERGAAGVTVEEICDEVGVSPRTFFNYYPTKLDAAFDMALAEIPPEAAAAFVASEGDLLTDALTLLASNAELPSDYARIRELLREQPDLGFNFWKQMIGRLKPVHALMQERTTDPTKSRLAFGLIVVAALGSMIRPGNDSDPDGALDRLMAEITEMKELLAALG